MPLFCDKPADGTLAEGPWGSDELAFEVLADGAARIKLPCADAGVEAATVLDGRVDWSFEVYNEDTGTFATGPDYAGALEGSVCGGTLTGTFTRVGDTMAVTLAHGNRASPYSCD